MSLVTAIRDYVDLVNSSYDALPVNANLQSWIMPVLAFILGSLKQAMLYLLSFQWLRDLLYLPLLVPQLSLATLRENCYPLESPLLSFFTFLEEPAYRDSKLLAGILNSFFACLPLSAAHLLSGRRLLVQGVPSGVAAGSGIIAGQCWFIACVVLGFRPFLIPWLAWEPLSYLLGVGLLVNTVYRITHERRIRVTRWNNKAELAKYFLLSFVLTWCEQTSIFQYLGNLTVGAEPTALDTFSSSVGGGSLLTDGAYVIGFAVGSCLFAFLFGWVGLRLKGAWAVWWSTTASRVTNWLNTFFLIALVAFSFASVPYYGLDYLVTSKLGFLPNDTALEGTILAPTTIRDINQMLGRLSDSQSFDTDVSTFDRGNYVLEEKPIAQSFEDLNYQGEYAWTRRLDKQVRHLTTRRAHPFWHRLLSEGPQTDSTDQPQSRSRSRETRVEGSSATDRPNGWLLGVARRGKGEIDATRGDREAVDQLLNRRAEVAGQLAEVASASDDGDGGASYPVAGDKQFERQFTEEFSSGLSWLFSVDNPPIPALAKVIKERYVANPLYSLLLRIDIDTFLGRQPSSHLLSPAEESWLFQKRQVLSQYCDGLRQYNELQNWDEFGALHHGSKTFASRVYNQQFKGTLKVVRRLFSISLEEGEGRSNRRVLKLDQPLFEQRPGKTRGSVDTPASQAMQGHQGLNGHLHEELAPFQGVDVAASPFLENDNPRPLYAGWDDESRRLVLTNRSLPRSEALHRAGNPRNGSKENQYGRLTPLLSRHILFTAWPIKRDTLVAPKGQSTVPYQAAFKSGQDPQEKPLAESLDIFGENADGLEGAWDMSAWPPNLRLRDDLPALFPSTRGGFLWPGHQQLRLGNSKG